MRSKAELETLWAAVPPAPQDRGTVELLCLRKGDGVHETPSSVQLTVAGGVVGDRWSASATPNPDYQVTLMNAAVARLIAGERDPSQAGDNLFVTLDLSEASLPAGTRLRAGTALLEVSEAPHTGCKKFRARFGAGALRWVNAKTNRGLRLRGVNCTVVEDGEVRVGDVIEPIRSGAPR